MPTVRQFIKAQKDDVLGEAHYWATMWHEIVHWTGHPERLARKFVRLGRSKCDYAFEELVAELGAAFLCGSLGIEGELHHDDYIGIWIKVLKNNYKKLYEAAAYAEQAKQYIHENATRDPKIKIPIKQPLGMSKDDAANVD